VDNAIRGAAHQQSINLNVNNNFLITVRTPINKEMASLAAAAIGLSSLSPVEFKGPCDRGHGEVLQLGGHTHRPGCGHDMVLHDDHFDYVGDDGLLHHLLDPREPACCDRHAAVLSDRSDETSGHDSVVVSHGFFANRAKALIHRKKPHSRSDAPPVNRLEGDIDIEAVTTKIYCQGICCPMEVPLVEAALGALPGVVAVQVAVVTKTVTAKHDPRLAPPAALVAALQEARLGASLTFPRKNILLNKNPRSFAAFATWLPPWHVLAALAALLVSLVGYLSGPTGIEWLSNFHWAALASVALCLPGIAIKALASLRHFILDIHVLISIAAAGAIALADYSEAGIVVVLFAIADFLESRCTGQARDAISAVLALKPDFAILAEDGSRVVASTVAPGTLILVRSGDEVPLDGVVVSGTSSFDESILTGESKAVVKHAGDEVKAGTLNSGGGTVSIKTVTRAEDTFVAGMARLVEEATSKASPSEAFVAKFAKIYTPVVLLACILIAFVPWSNPNADKKWWVYLSLQILVTACPCALVLSTPVTVISALARAAGVGILVKGGTVLETIQSVKVVTFDKTGTLTKGNFLVRNVMVTKEHECSEDELLRTLGSLERGSPHPLAAAIVGRAAARGVVCDAQVMDCESISGAGVRGIVDGRLVKAGTAEFVAHGLRQKGRGGLEGLVEHDRSVDGLGASACYVSVDGEYVGCVVALDSVRDEAAEAVAELNRLGITCAILTGDGPAVANGVGSAVGIDIQHHVHASLLPKDKLEWVAKYKVMDGGMGVGNGMWRMKRGKKTKGKVSHVGDGVNDAPALAAADVGIAMGVAGAAAALEAGDVALFTNDLRLVPALYRLARRAGTVIMLNVAFSITTKIAVLVLAATGHFTLWAAVLVDVGTALLVTVHGLTLLRWQINNGGAGAGSDGRAVPCVGLAAVEMQRHAECKDACCRSRGGGAEPCNTDHLKKEGKACCHDGAESERHHHHHGHEHSHEHGHKHSHEHSHEHQTNERACKSSCCKTKG